MLNFLYRRGLQSAHVEYINALTAFTGPHSVTYLPKGKEEGEEVEVSAAHIVIAVGGRPVVPREVAGAVEYAVTVREEGREEGRERGRESGQEGGRGEGIEGGREGGREGREGGREGGKGGKGRKGRKEGEGTEGTEGGGKENG
jgi:hypothetical protein